MRILLPLLAVLSAAPASSPYPNDGLYSVMECSPDIAGARCAAYPAPSQTMRDVDFRNFSIHRLFNPSKDVRLTNGRWEDGDERLALMEVHYLTPPSSEAEYALLAFSHERAGAAEWFAQVVEFSRKQWRVIEEFSVDVGNPNHPKFNPFFDESTKTLVLRFDGLGDSHSCGTATGSCRVSYKWDGNHMGSMPRD